MAVQGGLLAATIAQSEEERLKENVKKGSAIPIISFLVAKLAAYTVFGFILGWFGSLFDLSLTVRVVLQFAVAIFMIGTALNILNVHPIFRYFVLQPPKFITRIVRNESKSKNMFAPAILGAFTVFIPCGTTQAMMALSIASGTPILGATIMFVYTLGTSPVFFTLGYLATRLGETLQQKFMKAAAYAIILLAVFNLNNALALTGSSFNIFDIPKTVWCTVSFCDTSLVLASNAAGTEDLTITIQPSGYSPSNLVVKAGSQVSLRLVNNGGGGCTQAFTIPSLGIQKIVPIGSSNTITFTAPETPQELTFMCSMGMYRGKIIVRG